MTQSFDFIVLEAVSIDQIKTIKGRIQFTYFNPKGAYTAKKILDKRVTAAVDAGRCTYNNIYIYGFMNDYHTNRMVTLAQLKRPTRWDVDYTIDNILKENIDTTRWLDLEGPET